MLIIYVKINYNFRQVLDSLVTTFCWITKITDLVVELFQHCRIVVALFVEYANNLIFILYDKLIIMGGKRDSSSGGWILVG